MGLVAESVQNEHVQILKQRQGGVGDGAEIGYIGDVAKAEAQDGQISVHHGHGNQPLPPEVKGSVNELRVEPSDSSIGIRLVKDVFIDAANALHGPAVSINGNRRVLPEIKDADIVQPQDVVGVVVRKDYGVQPLHPGAQSLLAKVGCGVDYYHPSVEL